MVINRKCTATKLWSKVYRLGNVDLNLYKYQQKAIEKIVTFWGMKCREY